MTCSSAIIDILSKEIASDPKGLCFIYFRYQNRDSQTTDKLLGILVRQLLEAKAEIPLSLLQAYEKHTKKKTNTQANELILLLEEMLQFCSTNFIILDALDECKPNTREHLLRLLLQLPDTNRILCTSRPISEIGADLKAHCRLEIHANESDVSIFVDHQSERMTRLRTYMQTDRLLKNDIVNAITSKADGMLVLQC
jgi:hypothetical protein